MDFLQNNLAPSQEEAFLSDSSTPEGKRYVKDCIHNQITFDQEYWRLIDTRSFQRLRDIKQLGAVYYVYPGAVNSRFEHSLGVGYIAQNMMEHFLKVQDMDLQLERGEFRTVVLAGLCHDLGLGIHSHFFDRLLIPALAPTLDWTVEEASAMMLGAALEEAGLDLEQGEVRRVEDLIKGECRGEKKWLFDIVKNKRNFIDADKFDYIQRDALSVGMHSNRSYDHGRLIQSCRVLEDKVSYHIKNSHYLKTLFQLRYTMFKQVYFHRVAQSIDHMFLDAMLEANRVYKFLETLRDPARYLNVTDNIIKEVEFSKKVELQEAQKILKKIKKRDLYKYVGEFVLHDEGKLEGKVKASDIVDYAGDPLQEKDVVVHEYTLNYGFGQYNPVDFVQFYESNQKNQGKDKSNVLPSSYSERYVRIFSKQDGQVKNLQGALKKLQGDKKNGLMEGSVLNLA